MNIATVQFDLQEAQVHLRELVAELKDGTMRTGDTPALAVQLGHVLDHLCMAWNARELSPEEKAALSQDDHDRMCNTVPNFHGEKVMGEVAVT